ncbi:geranylgeranylglycerol-phosphate geranylgeranyltransferase [Nafulsella turpanensis]|uniref:geranylgeranylglycerol-phosphate geranylgeranyltransferase n=1 Tax=Nafulsella turpanensis TaxID=1265690 RepID=UPI000345FC43|nr:geranylgeranylglycerol-phosphate geranylgeranyltransferase [Nafulsella turpanensis]
MAANVGIRKPVNFSIKAFLKLTRIQNLLIIGLTQYLTAIFLVGPKTLWWKYMSSLELLMLSSSTILIAAAGYIINDYYDVKIDYINKPERVIVGKVLKRRIVMAAHTIFNVVGIAMGFWLMPRLGLVNFLAALWLWLYSNQLKRLPFIGNFSVALLTGLSIAVVALYYQEHELLIYTYAVFAFAITLIREIIKDMEDLKGDATFGCKTLPILFGIARTKMLEYVLLIMFVGLLVMMAIEIDREVLENFFLFMIFPVIYFIIRLARADNRKDFAFLSLYCKLLMLAGVLSMMFF